jgi:hypothetical protein
MSYQSAHPVWPYSALLQYASAQVSSNRRQVFDLNE